MTKVVLLERLRDFTVETVRDIIMPVRPGDARGKGDAPLFRPADVYLMRLEKSSAAEKATPYILHQAITGKDTQQEGARASGFAVVRSIFAVYNEDEQKGGLMLLNLMERLRIALLEQVVIGKQFQLDLTAGLETLVYPDDTAPYYAGEMMSTWRIPRVTRIAKEV